jgi:uncharacterized membrane protein YesL
MGLFSGMIMGKSNRPDFTPEMMPKNRMELFFEMLKLNLFNLLKVNLMYFVFWIPFWLWTWLHLQVLVSLNTDTFSTFIEQGYLSVYLLGLIPCIAITGPGKAALKYVTRNYARDEHVWLWSDFIGAIKANWKQGLGMSTINAVFTYLFLFGLSFYSSMANATGSYMYLFLQVILVMLGIMFMLVNLYVWPMMVTYDLKLSQILRNSMVLALGRLPFSALFGLLTALPVIISGFWLPFLIWYFIIGYAMASFVNCSYTNAAFDRFFNSRIEGAEVGRGMQKAEEDDEWEDLDPDEDEDDKK